MPPQDTQPAHDQDHDNSHHTATPQEPEWTQVTSKSRRSGRRTAPLPVVPRTSDLRPAADLAADHRRLRARWEDDECCRRLRHLLSTHASRIKSVSRAVNLGVGTFDPADGSWEAKRSSHVQLIAFLVIVEELEKVTGGKIECIFQDPVFTRSDKDFLASLGHQVVETPAACHMIDADSLLYGIHLYRPIYAMALENSLPAIFVGTGWDVWDDLSSTEGLERMEEMEKTYTRCAFPQDSHGQAFSSTSIYWKPAPEAATASSEQEAQGKPSAEDEISSKLESTTIS